MDSVGQEFRAAWSGGPANEEAESNGSGAAVIQTLDGGWRAMVGGLCIHTPGSLVLASSFLSKWTSLWDCSSVLQHGAGFLQSERSKDPDGS